MIGVKMEHFFFCLILILICVLFGFYTELKSAERKKEELEQILDASDRNQEKLQQRLKTLEVCCIRISYIRTLCKKISELSAKQNFNNEQKQQLKQLVEKLQDTATFVEHIYQTKN